MRVPTREEFSPLTDVVDMFGLPDPTQVLPQLENQLESVPGSSDQFGKVAEGLRGAADDLDGGAAQVTWEGTAGDGFRDKNAEAAHALRGAADNITAAQDDIINIDQDTKDLIKKILFAIGSVATIVGGILTIIFASTAIGVIAIIAGVVFLIGTLINEVIWLINKALEGIQWLGSEAMDLLEAAGNWIDDISPAIGDGPTHLPSPQPGPSPTPPAP